MKIINTCCGSNVRKRVPTEKTPSPPNPKVKGGVAVIFIGSGNINLIGPGTGSIYYASDHHRHFRVFAEDADSIVRNPYVILKP